MRPHPPRVLLLFLGAFVPLAAGKPRTWKRSDDVMGARAMALAILGMLLVSACSGGEMNGTMDRTAEVEERQRHFFQAMQARDGDRIGAFFAEDAVLHVAGRPAVEGRGAIQDFYRNLFRFLQASSATPGELRASPDGEMAYGTGSTVNEFGVGDDSEAYAGKYLVVWRRVDGSWRVAAYAVSSDAP
jgi:ketosteroid isomerase-like protein